MDRLRRASYYLTGIMPHAVALVLGFLLLMHISVLHDQDFYHLPQIMRRHIPIAFVYIAFIFAAWQIVYRLADRFPSFAIFLVFLFAFIPRIILLRLFKEQIIPFSDFLWSWDVAQGAREGYSFIAHLPFPAYQVWAFAEYLITRLVPNEYIYVLYTNATIDALIAVVIVLLAKNLRPTNRIAILAGLIYAAFPSAIIYCTVGTPEFAAIILNLLGIICLVKCFDGKEHYCKIIIAGVLFGLSSSFKSFSAIIIIAYCIVDLLTVKKKFFYRICEWCLLIFVTCMTKQIILIVTSRWIGVDLNKYSSGVFYHQLLVGLNTEGEGQVHLGTLSRGFWRTFLENGNDSAAAGEYAKSLLIDNWKHHYAQIPELMWQKMIWAWQDDLIPIQYFLQNIETSVNNQELRGLISEYDPCISQVMYIGLMGAGICRLALHRTIDGIKHEELFINMIVFGFFCLLLIIEAQSRYKCLVMPMICIQAAVGIDMISRAFSKWKYSKGQK